MDLMTAEMAGTKIRKHVVSLLIIFLFFVNYLQGASWWKVGGWRLSIIDIWPA